MNNVTLYPWNKTAEDVEQALSLLEAHKDVLDAVQVVRLQKVYIAVGNVTAFEPFEPLLLPASSWLAQRAWPPKQLRQWPHHLQGRPFP